MNRGKKIPEKTVERLSIYRRCLMRLSDDWGENIFSYQLANQTGISAAQVRRDLMFIGYSGSPNKGYQVEELSRSIGEILDAPQGQKLILIGIGHLGRALLDYIASVCPNLSLVAAFDINPRRTDRIIHGVRCYPMDRLAEIVVRERVTLGVMTVPASAAQDVLGQMADCGIRGVLNFAPTRLKVPAGLFVENIDITMFIEKVAYYTHQRVKQEDTRQ